MKKSKLLLALVIVLTFLGGIYTGIQFSSTKPQEKPIKSGKAPQSAIKPQTKDLPKVEKAHSKVLIGYIQDFRDPNQVDYSQLTHVIFSFAHPTKEGGILLNGDSALKNLRTIVAKAKKSNTKVILAVGGWYHISGGESYPYFKAAISNPNSRTKLVNELTSLADRENLDGIDIDFEHPHSKEDAENLAAFAKQLSVQLHSKKKELSVAVNSKINAVTLTEIGYVQYEPSMFKDVDHVNIMAYDGQWDEGYNAANLSPYPFTEKIVNYWSKLFEEQNISKDKLVLGVPFYAQPKDPKIKQVSYGAIINQNPANANSDTINMNGTTYYYNGAATMKKKTNLALDHGFGGMMIWELGLDAKGSNSLTSSISGTIKKATNTPVKYYAVVNAQ
ncbi:glycoside hydrolase family 18 protein [Neobacillus drentensis]|uniref:glycoside hydrolase family 18 protein n=1 Tax=Neobacillus drentensis TaxID=220684 RepID=UPI002FFEF45A